MKLKTISRRSFLKGAGVTALAVAAAGVMTGCSGSSGSKVPGTNVPDVPGVTSETIDVYFVDVQGGFVGTAQTMKVLKDAKAVQQEDIDPAIVPKGYSISDGTTGSGLVFEIQENEGQNRYIKVPLVKHTDAEETGDESQKRIKITLQFANAAQAGETTRDLVVTAKATDWVHYEDVKDSLPADVTSLDTTWKSELEITDKGYYIAKNPMVVMKNL